MSEAEIAQLGDIFTQRILIPNQTPLTLRQLIEAIEALDSPGFPRRKMFLVAEGAQAVALGRDFARNERLVFTWQTSEHEPVDLLLSTVAAPDDPDALLQLIAWSKLDSAFHFFERKNRRWAWAGNGFHALVPPTRGQGPFDSHINGALVMKELKAPWTHWHSMSSSIDRSIFGAASAFNTHPLFAELEGAEQLESIVRTGVRRWTRGRFGRDLHNGVLERLPEYLRQALWCTSFNLVSSSDTAANSMDPELNLPTTAFFDAEAIEFLASAIDATADVIPGRQFVVAADHYRAALARRNVVVRDDANPPHETAGETQFAFLAPERAFEDLVVLIELVNLGILSPRLGLCLMMVDFSNPVFSPDRAALLRHVPDRITAGDDGQALDEALVAAMRRSAYAGSPEQAFLDLWDHADLLGHTTFTLADYHTALQERLSTPQGLDDVVNLVNSRREVLRRTRSLLEFASTLPSAAAPAHLAMRPDGSIYQKASSDGEGEL